MKKIIIFNVDNVIDVITNSSSELFVLEAESESIVKEMISSAYPEYLNEYEEIKNIVDLSIDQLDNFMDYMCHSHTWPAEKRDYPVPDGFTFDELYEPESDKPAWNGSLQYKLRNNVVNPTHKWDSSFVTEENKESIIQKLSPKKDTWFLFSIDENPDYEYQEKLECIGTRYHLG